MTPSRQSWFQRNITLSVIIALVVLVAGAVSTVTLLEAHATNQEKHLTLKTLDEKFVPRTELDHRLKAQGEQMQRIEDGIVRIEGRLEGE